MMTASDDLIGAFESHSVDHIRAILADGLDARAPIRGKAPVTWLTEMYMRSSTFPDCLRLLLDRGAVLDDPLLAPVLLDDGAAVRATRALVGASMLHVAAEYGCANAARALIDIGADVNAAAAVDDDGLNGQTPIFHTVNSLLNYSRPILDMLLDAGARPDIALRGITWGKGFEWETTIFDVTPIAYAQAGLLPQMHRKEQDIYDVIRRLLVAARRPVPPLANIPNRYLRPRQ
jgi:Ankyrin repeat